MEVERKISARMRLEDTGGTPSSCAQNIATQNVKQLETKISDAFTRAQAFDKPKILGMSFDDFFKKDKLLTNISALLAVTDKETLDAALAYRKCRRALKKLLNKIERLEVLHAKPAEKENALAQRKKAVAANAAAIEKKITRSVGNVRSIDFLKLYEAVEASRQSELDKLNQTSDEWTTFVAESCPVTLYRDGKSFIHLNHKIGSGMDKKVFLAINYESNSLAVHSIAGFNKNAIPRLQSEVEILEGIPRTHRIACVKKKRTNSTEKSWFTNYYNKGDMFIFSQEKNDFKELSASGQQLLIESMIECISKVHENKIIHRDVKSENFLLHALSSISKQKKLHLLSITDFGLSRKWHLIDSYYPGTSTYAAPEVILGYMHPGYESDWFSLGATLGYFYGMPVKEHLTKIIFVKEPPENTLQSLVKNLTNEEPNKRFGSKEALEAVKNIDWRVSKKWDVKIVPLDNSTSTCQII